MEAVQAMSKLQVKKNQIQRKVIQRNAQDDLASEEANRINLWLSNTHLGGISNIRTVFSNRNSIRDLIKTKYYEAQNRSVEFDLKQVYGHSVDLAEMWPLLYRETNVGFYNSFATFLLPDGTVQEHLMTMLRSMGEQH